MMSPVLSLLHHPPSVALGANVAKTQYYLWILEGFVSLLPELAVIQYKNTIEWGNENFNTILKLLLL